MESSPIARLLVKLSACWISCALLPCVLLLCPRAARADDVPKPHPKLPPFLRLEYLRGALTSCPNREMLEDRIKFRAQRDPFNDVAPALLRVTIARRAPLYVATVEVRDSSGGLVWLRPFDPLPTCLALVNALAYLIGTELREPPPASPRSAAPAPAKVEDRVEGRVEPPKPPPEGRSRLGPVAPAPAKVETPSEPLRLNLGIAGALVVRTAASPLAFNLAADAGLRWRSFSGALEFRWTPPEVVAVDTTGRELVRVTQYAGGIRPCGHFRAFFACGVGQVVAVVTKGALDTMPLSTATTVTTGAMGVRVGADVPVPIWGRRFVFRPWVDAIVTLRDVRIRFVDTPATNIGNVPPAWTTTRFSVFFGAGVVTDLWLKK